ncbi:hypothetical protein [Herbaspirillum rubrisubalbicans]|uniref:Uncharacterized protein n=1 Tax=Herbaspirillum rubrisubalbicans TaxID=80842 RepID=A0AAD0XEF5_9BURK|nr:hypothetical protein [Herbaspirillum rubrisubalbicans]AYR23016.1 hypothetical protein RC54_03920 [Herbaspirillum rubrisubalbicans]
MCGGGGAKNPAPTVDPAAERQNATDLAREATNAKLAEQTRLRQRQTVLASGAGASSPSGGAALGGTGAVQSVLATGKDKLGAS